MSFNHVTMGPIGGYPPDTNIQNAPFAAHVTNNVASTIIPSMAGKKISIHAFYIAANQPQALNFLEVTPAGATIQLFNGNSSSNFQIAANTPMLAPFQQFPWMTFAPGNAFGVSTAGGQSIFIGGQILYVQA